MNATFLKKLTDNENSGSLTVYYGHHDVDVPGLMSCIMIVVVVPVIPILSFSEAFR